MGRSPGQKIGKYSGRKYFTVSTAVEPELNSFLNIERGETSMSVYVHNVLKAHMDAVLGINNE